MLACWKARMLSVGAVFTLIRSVVDALPVYYLSLFKISNVVAASVDHFRKKFYWNVTESRKKCYWVSWKNIASPKSLGGLRIKSIVDFNYALLSKWIWRFFSDKESLWNEVIRKIYGADGGMSGRTRAGLKGLVWNQIMYVISETRVKGVHCLGEISKKVRDGRSTSFWFDNWLDGKGTLATRFPQLLALEIQNDCYVADRWCCIDGYGNPYGVGVFLCAKGFPRIWIYW